MLLLNRGRAVGFDRLVDELWLGAPPASAQANLRQYVARLRALLADAGHGQLLNTSPDGYTLDVPPGSLDAERFAHLRERGHRAAAHGRRDEALELLERARVLWRGRPLEGLTLGARTRRQVATLEDQHTDVLEDLARLRVEAGDHRAAVGCLREILAWQPLRESVWVELVSALYRAGRRGEALQAYASARRTLATKLGVEPSAALQRLHAAVIQGADLPGGEALGVAR